MKTPGPVFKLINLKVFAYHGVFPEEKKQGQTFTVNIQYRLKDINFDDDLAKSVDYADLAAKAQSLFIESVYNLLEQLAKDLSVRLLEQFPLIEEISVEVVKTSPPASVNLGAVSVRYTSLR